MNRRQSSLEQPFIDAEEEPFIESNLPTNISIPLLSINPIPMSERPKLGNVLMEDALDIYSQWDALGEARNVLEEATADQQQLDPDDQGAIM